MSRDFLLEIGTEEIPARFMQSTLEQLKSRAQQLFEEARLEWKSLAAYGTPRRLALYVGDLAERQRDLTLEIKGPAKKAAFDSEGKATRAALGFANSRGVKVEDLVVKDTGSGEYVFALVQEIGRPTRRFFRRSCQNWCWDCISQVHALGGPGDAVRPAHSLAGVFIRQGSGSLPARQYPRRAPDLWTQVPSSRCRFLQEPWEYFSSLEKAWG